MATADTNKLWSPSFIIGTFANFTATLNYFMLMVVMTAYVMSAYNAPESVAAFTASIFIIGTLFARLVSGAAMERVGRKRFAIIGVVFTIVFTGLCLWATDVPILMGIRFLHGFAYGMFSTCMATMVTAIVPPARKGEGIGYYMLSVTLGAAIGPFLGIFVSNRFDFRILFIMALIASCMTLLLVCLMRVPKAARKQTKAQRAEERVAEELADAAVVDAPELEGEFDRIEKDADAPSAPAASRGWMSKLIEVGVLPIAGVAGLVYFGYSSLLTFLTPFAATVDLTRAASVFFIVYAISMFITRPFTGKAFDRRGPTPVMVPAFISFALGMVVLGTASNDWMILGAGLLAGFGVGTVQSCGLAMAVRATPDARLSLANATFYILLDLGVGIGPLILGLIVPVIGYRSMYLCMAGLGIVALVLFLFVSRKPRSAR